MGDRYYVVTDAAGVAHAGEIERHFDLVAGSGLVDGGPVVLRTTTALLDELDEVIFEAEPIGSSKEITVGAIQADDARLLRRTAWDARGAAEFALACADHVAQAERGVTIPGGHTIGSILDDAKGFLADADAQKEGRLAQLARFATARRLNRAGASVGDVARARLEEDLQHEIDATSDPEWTMLASVVDAVLATVEAIRYIALPRYVAEREEAGGERDEQAGVAFIPQIYTSPWGPFTIGAEHESAYTPTSHLAREAAFRARETVGDRDGQAAQEAETAWQVAQLESILSRV